MTMINLREYYPDSYIADCFIAVPEEIAEKLRRFKLEDEAYRNKAYFSLDYGENVEREAVFLVMTPVIIKYPFWRMTAENPEAVYACVNDGEAMAPEEIKNRSICINGDIGAVLKEIQRR